MSFFRNLFLLFIFITLSSGCGSLKSLNYTSNQNKSIHIKSCGPDSINSALKSLKKEGHDVKVITKEEISRELKRNNKCSSIMRDIASMFVYEGRAITFPSEITSFFTKRGITIKIVNSLEDLKNKDTAIVLVHKRSTIHYHWMTYPNDNNILNFFGKDTVICRIYLLVK